ncbi:hypothetical protein QZM52_14790 [Burkholderia metallica]|uniref:Uncharacterized protein n=1 Tax=Burkholderia metallica TaxID=488729 RepID=A0ABT8PDL0_9BURK|nr:hypothetical protein [Burkholderia metallica]
MMFDSYDDQIRAAQGGGRGRGAADNSKNSSHINLISLYARLQPFE